LVPRRLLLKSTLVLVFALTLGQIVDAAPRSGSVRHSPSGEQAVAYCASPEETALLELINAYREVNGRPPLVLAASLGAAALHHAESMAAFDYFDYTLVPEDITFSQNISNFGYPGSYLGANIAAGQSSDSAATVFSQWLASPSQRDNLLNPRFLAVGIGAASNPDSTFDHYWAAAFGELSDVELASACSSSGGQTGGETTFPTSPLPTVAATETPSPTNTPTPTPTATDAPTVSPSPTPTTEPTETATDSPTVTATPSSTPSATPTALAASPTSTSTPPPTAVATKIVVPAASPFNPNAPTPTATMPVATPVAGIFCMANRESAKASQEVKLTCLGFTPDEEVILYWNEPREANKLDSFTAGKEGAGAFSFLAPETPTGRYTLIIQGVTTLTTASVPLQIIPGLLVSPRSGDPGDVVTADLTGFKSGESVTLTWYENATTPRVLRTVAVGEDGSITTTFRASSSPKGQHTVQAVGFSGTKATATFEIK
jgi:uncharacterized protein YkwD